MRVHAPLVLLGLLVATEAAGSPEIAVSDAEFGFVGGGESAIHYVAISSPNYSLPLLISGGSVSGDPDQWFSFASAGCDRATACPFNPAVSISQTPGLVPVRCTPPAGASGTRTATIAFTSNATVGTGVATLRCTAGANAIAVVPTSHLLDFGLVNLRGAASATSVVRIRNPGTTPISADAAVIAGRDGARFQVPPFTPIAIAPGGQLDLAVTYSPIAERSVSDPDIGELTVTVSGAIGPGVVSIALRGRGGAPHASITSLPTFADAFTNPGPAAQILPITIANTGESVLALSTATVTEGATWKIMNPDPVEVPAGTSFSYLVRFTPPMPGPAAPGTFRVATNDVANPNLTATLTGNGLRRNVTVGAPVIDLYYAAIATTAKLSDGPGGDLFTVVNLDATHAFEIREIRVTDGEGAFAVLGAANVRLEAGATRSFEVAFTPPRAGSLQATASVFLDSDPVPHASVTLRGEGLFVQANGGGCGATPSAGWAVVAAVTALLLRRRRYARNAVVAGMMVVASTSAARADTRDLDIAVFDPTPSTSGSGFALLSPEVGRSGTWTARALVSYAYNPLVLLAAPNNNIAIQNRTTLGLGGAFAFGGRFEVGVRMPLYIQSGENLSSPTMFGEPPGNGTARGNLAVHGKAQVWRHRHAAGIVSTGIGLSIGLPTASDQQFAGSDGVSLRPLALASFAPAALSGRLITNVNAGAVVRATAVFHDIHQRSGALWGVGAIYRMQPTLAVTAELFGELVPGGRRDAMGESAILHTAEALVGVRYQIRRYVDLDVAVSRGLASGPGEPAIRGTLAVTVTVSPPSPTAVVRSGSEDSDKDGQSDDFDRCPDLAEDRDGFSDDDGCPDLDNDGDAIPDAADSCPNAAEDMDGFDDGDGCPDLDNDRDGIRDAFDHCPIVAETINGNGDDDGCPDTGEGLVTIESDRLVVAAEPQFTATGDVTPGSFNALGQLAATLRAHTELAKIRIVAPPSRAQTIVKWLVQWGISPERLEASDSTSNEVRYEIVKPR